LQELHTGLKCEPWVRALRKSEARVCVLEEAGEEREWEGEGAYSCTYFVVTLCAVGEL